MSTPEGASPVGLQSPRQPAVAQEEYVVPPPHAVWVQQTASVFDPSALKTEQPATPASVMQDCHRQQNPWRVVMPFLLLCVGLNLAFSGDAFSWCAFVLEFGLALWWVRLLRQRWDQPFSQLLWPLGWVFVLWGVALLWNIPVVAMGLVLLAIWLLWRQFRPSKK
ncbi:MAG: hypothetical protein RL180_1618 [Pseudomonadota bacterium]|jgi:hypothetical protein